MKRAITLEDVKKTLTPRPLTAEELDEFFVETSDVRDRFVSRRDEIFERLGAKPGAKVLLAGHAGSGKSTELVKLREEHAGELLIADFSIIEEGDPGNVRVESLLVLVVEAILRVAEQQQLELEDKTLASIYGWFNETFQVRESELKYTGAAGAGVNIGDSVWGKILGLTAFLKADIRTGSGVLNKTIARDDRRLSQLAYQCGLLIKEAQLAIRRAAGKDLVLLIEDLDKVTVAEADALFIENPSPLAGLPCKAIFTAPIFLLCNPRAAVLESYFEVVTLPMIKLRQPDGRRFDEGRDAILDILRQRIDVEAVIEPAALDLAIDKTGGVLRHLFLALQHASASASQAVRRAQRAEPRITKGDVRYGLNRLKSDILRRIGVMGLPDAFEGIVTQDLYDRLRELTGRSQRVTSDRINLLLLQAHALIEYNGDQWHQVHPLVAEHVETLPSSTEET